MRQRPAEALDHLERALPLLEELVQETGQGEFQLWLSHTLWLLGRAYADTGASARAHDTWIRGIQIVESLIRRDRDFKHLDVWVRLSVSLNRLEEARPIIEELHAIGFREKEFVDFLSTRGLE